MEDEVIEVQTLQENVKRAQRIKNDARLLFGRDSHVYRDARLAYRLACADLRALARA